MGDQAALSLPCTRQGGVSYFPTCTGRGKGYHLGSTPREERRCGELSAVPTARTVPRSNGIVIRTIEGHRASGHRQQLLRKVRIPILRAIRLRQIHQTEQRVCNLVIASSVGSSHQHRNSAPRGAAHAAMRRITHRAFSP